MNRKRIGYTSSYVPPEIIRACGLTPARMCPSVSLAAADGYLPRNFSVEVRALLASALEGNPATGSGQVLELEAVIFLDEDDTSRRFFDVWAAYTDIPALGLVPLPRLDNDLARQHYVRALNTLAKSLTAISCRALTDDELCRAIDLYNQQRGLWRALRQRWIEGGISAGDWYDLRWHALTTDPETANTELATRLSPGPLAGEAEKELGISRKIRLIVLGGMNIPRRFITFLEACGARIVAEDSEADERTLTDAIPLDSQPPIEALAAAYLNKPPGPRPNALTSRLTNITRLLDERCVQGVIAYYPKFADAYLAEYIQLAELFRERGLPALLLEDDGESGFSGQQRTRVEAFLEVLA